MNNGIGLIVSVIHVLISIYNKHNFNVFERKNIVLGEKTALCHSTLYFVSINH